VGPCEFVASTAGIGYLMTTSLATLAASSSSSLRRKVGDFIRTQCIHREVVAAVAIEGDLILAQQSLHGPPFYFFDQG